MLKEALLVGVGGFVGSVGRYLIATAMSSVPLFNITLPIATLTVNGIGSLLIGILLGSLSQNGWYYLLVVGFCGGFTTFSTFSAELFGMVESQSYTTAIIYLIASIAICLIATWLGITLGRQI